MKMLDKSAMTYYTHDSLAVSDAKVLKRLKGHSGCKIYLMQSDNLVFVRKCAGSPEYNARLQKQMELQIDHATRFNVPKVYGFGHYKGNFFFDMEYIHGTPFYMSIEHMDCHDIDKHMKYIFRNMDIRNSDQLKGKIFEKKIDSLCRLLSNCEYFMDAINLISPILSNISYMGKGHGDLTLENILICYNNELYYIDFLDSFYHSMIMDCAKLLQDLELHWSWRYTTISPTLYINTNYARRLLYRFVLENGSHRKIRDMYNLLLLNVLRIIPYCKDNITLNWCYSSTRYLIDTINDVNHNA